MKDQHRVLVVDDSVIVADATAELMKRFGSLVQVANDGPSALSIVAEFEPHLVLLDIEMPGMDGFEVARQLRRMPLAQRARIIAHTFNAPAPFDTEAKTAGFDGWITKPITASDVATILEMPALKRVNGSGLKR